MEHIEPKYSTDSKLQIESICSITFLSILEVIPKTKKFSTLSLIDGPNPTLSMYYLVHIEIAQQAYNPPATTDDRLWDIRKSTFVKSRTYQVKTQMHQTHDDPELVSRPYQFVFDYFRQLVEWNWRPNQCDQILVVTFWLFFHLFCSIDRTIVCMIRMGMILGSGLLSGFKSIC